MEPIYILSIVVGSLFLILLIVFLCIHFINKRKYNALRTELRQMYADKNAPKLDYDFAGYDEEVRRKLQATGGEGGQLTIDDIMQSGSLSAQDEAVFAPVDVENVEEITGNYQPEK